MKKKLVVALVTLAVTLSCVVGGTYAWFFSNGKVIRKVDTAELDLVICRVDELLFENVLPGETVNLGGNMVSYYGDRPAIIQFKLFGTGTLYTGAENHKDWLALDSSIKNTDYRLNANGVNYDFTEKRMDEILSLIERKDRPYLNLYESSYDANTFYTYIGPEYTKGVFNLAVCVSLKFSGEFGGGYVADKSKPDERSPSRQFEQSSVFEEVGVRITAIQVTEEAILDVLGETARQDVEDMVTSGFFTPPVEWTYTG